METNLILGIIPIVISLIVLFLVIRMERRYRRLFKGKNAESLEDLYTHLSRDVHALEKNQESIVTHAATLDARLKKTIRKVAVARFNPFADQGSNQSFAISFVNDEGDGVVMSSLYSRDRVSVFAKPIQNGASAHDLTEEEAEVVERSLK